MGGFLKANLLTVTKSAWRDVGVISARNFTVSKSTGRFTDFHTNSCGRFPDFNTRSASRLTDSPNLLADLLTVSKSAGRFAEFTKSADRNVGVCISAGRLTDFHKIYWPIYWLSPNLLGDLLTFTKSASRNEGKHWLSPNLPADLLTVTKSAGRFADIHIKTSCRNEGMFLPANILIVTKSASRFAECYQICWQKCGGPVFLLANLWILTKFTGQFTECHQICQQICWLSWNLPTEM